MNKHHITAQRVIPGQDVTALCGYIVKANEPFVLINKLCKACAVLTVCEGYPLYKILGMPADIELE